MKNPERILVVDDEESVRDLLGKAIRMNGYGGTAVATSEDALVELARDAYDLVLIDIMMPGRDGVWLLRRVRDLYPDLVAMMLTAVDDSQVAVKCLLAGAEDYLTKPFDMSHLEVALDRALEKRRLKLEVQEYRQNLDARVQEKTGELSATLFEVRAGYDTALQTMVEMQEQKLPYARESARRVVQLAARLGTKWGLEGDALHGLVRGAGLHDIGELIVPDRILFKKGPLHRKDWAEVRKHPEAGEKLLRNARHLEPARSVVLYHHERWDGTGYPRGLVGEEIPILARLFAAVDAFDAMTHDRPYRKARPALGAVNEIARCSGSQFDPQVAEVLAGVIAEEWAPAGNTAGTAVE